MLPEADARCEPGVIGNPVDVAIACFQQTLCQCQPLRQQPTGDRCAGGLAKLAGVVAPTHSGTLRHIIQADRLRYVLRCPSHAPRQPVAIDRPGQRLLNILGLAAAAMWRGDQPAGQAVRHIGTVVERAVDYY